MNVAKRRLSQNVLRASALFALAISPVAASSARAHGTYPGATRLAFDPERSGHILAATNLGLMRTEDGGASWKWSCIAAYRADTLDDPVFALGKSSALVIGHSGGLVSSSDTCGFSDPMSGVDRAPVHDVAYDGAAHRFWSISSTVSSSAAYVSDDGGANWTVAHRMPEGQFLRSLRVAPSDGKTVYLSATRASSSYAASTGGESIVYRTRDGGKSWDSFAFALGATEYDLYLIGIDPSDSKRVFARTSTAGTERIMLSEDGGETFKMALTAEGPFLAFAVADGQAYVGSDRSGLFRSEDNGRSFQPLKPDLPIHCLALHEGKLYMCPGYARADYEIGVSTDHGQTFKPILEFKQFTGEVVCGEGSALSQLCADELPVARRALEMLEAARHPTSNREPTPEDLAEPMSDQPEPETVSESEPDAGMDTPSEYENPKVPGSCGVKGAGALGESQYNALWAGLLMVGLGLIWRRSGNVRGRRETSSREGNEHA